MHKLYSLMPCTVWLANDSTEEVNRPSQTLVSKEKCTFFAQMQCSWVTHIAKLSMKPKRSPPGTKANPV